MALTTLDANTALIVVDLQKGIVAYPLAHPIGEIVSRARSLADAFRARGLPVALVNVAGSAPGRTEHPRNNQPVPAVRTDLIAEIDQQPPGDIVVTKRTWGAFASTDLEDQLRARGVTQVVFVGVDTVTGVGATTDTRPTAHDYSIAQVFPGLGETSAAQEIIELLARSA